MCLCYSFYVLPLSLLPECARAQQWPPALFTHRIHPQERELRDDPVPAVLVPGLGRLVRRLPGPRQAWRATAKSILLGYSRWETHSCRVGWQHLASVFSLFISCIRSCCHRTGFIWITYSVTLDYSWNPYIRMFSIIWYSVVLAEILRNHIKSRLSDCWPWWYHASPAETEDLFDPLEDSHTLNTFTRRDHLFARLEFLLEKGGVTLFHQDRRGDKLHESGVIQLEFSGTQKQSVDWWKHVSGFVLG